MDTEGNGGMSDSCREVAYALLHINASLRELVAVLRELVEIEKARAGKQ